MLPENIINDPSYNQFIELNERFIRNQLIFSYAINSHVIFYHKYLVEISPFTNETHQHYKFILSQDKYTSYVYCYNDNGILKRHRENYPAVIHTYNNEVVNEEYFKNNIPHRISGPQEIQYYENKIVSAEIYRENNKLHRTNGPAYIKYFFEPHKINIEDYRINNIPHRLDGPAYTIRNIRGKIISKLWIVNGKQIDTKEHPRFENGKLCGKVKLTQEAILKAMLFDREYGSFLKDMYDKLSS